MTKKEIAIFENLIALKNENIGRLFSKIYRKMAIIFNEEIAKRGFNDITIQHMAIMGNLELDGISINELAQKANISKQAISKMTKELVVNNYIITKKSETDNRSINVYCTSKGLKLISNALECSNAMKQKIINLVGNKRTEHLIIDLNTILNFYDK